jgi:hypothetical protein
MSVLQLWRFHLWIREVNEKYLIVFPIIVVDDLDLDVLNDFFLVEDKRAFLMHEVLTGFSFVLHGLVKHCRLPFALSSSDWHLDRTAILQHGKMGAHKKPQALLFLGSFLRLRFQHIARRNLRRSCILVAFGLTCLFLTVKCLMAVVRTRFVSSLSVEKLS